MSQNPYQSPETTSYTTGNPVTPQVRLVAKYQRWVLLALLAGIVINILAFATTGQDWPVRALVILVALAVGIFSMIAIFLLASEVSGTGTAVVCAILMFLPCISLIVLLIINQKATSYLQSHGVRVGLLGANPDTI